MTNNTSCLESKDMLSRVYTGDDLYVSITYHNVQLEYRLITLLSFDKRVEKSWETSLVKL